MITHKEYMNGTYTHEEYYSQFVNDTIKQMVIRCIGLSRIKNSIDPHFNDIPLKKWDNLEPYIRRTCSASISKANSRGGVSSSDCVCIAKQAARMIKESNE